MTTNNNSPKSTTAKDSSPEAEVCMIVFYEKVVGPDGGITDRVHGPMPIGEWDSYSRERGL